MRKILLCGLMAFGLSFPVTTMAQDTKTILDLPAGHTILNVSASEQREVEQDLLVANLRYQAENKDPKALQNDINDIMKKAVEKAKKTKDVKVSTQQYYVHQYDPPRPRPKPGQTFTEEDAKKFRTWRGQQGLQLKSKSADELLELTGELQKMGLIMNGLNYTLTPEKMEETRDDLMEAALEKIKDKAGRTAKVLGKSTVQIREINVDTGGNYHPQPMMRTMAAPGGAAMEMAAPVATPGESNISMSVSARVVLKP